MRSSRLGLFLLVSVLVVVGSNCGYYNRVMARKNLVDGSEAYKNRKFSEAEQFFRAAVARDPQGDSLEGKTAQVFLARTLHSEYIGNRSYSFTEGDFLGPKGMALSDKIMAKGTPLTQWLYSQLSPDTIQQYQHYQSAPSGTDDDVKKKNELGKSHINQLSSDLNKVLTNGQSIYDPARFSGVQLSDFTKQYMAQPNLSSDKIIRVNRLLLEDAFPNEIAKRPKPEEAIDEYKKALAMNPNDQSSYKAIASLYENLQRQDDWLDWVTKRSQSTSIAAEQRAEALTSLAAKKNTCANEITDTEKTKKTVNEGGKQIFKFVKPENQADLDTLKKCVEEGTALIDQAMALEPAEVKNAASFNVKGATDKELVQKSDLFKVFESARSYKASLLFQAMRLAEMENRMPDRDQLKTQAEAARANFLALSDVVKKIGDEIDARKAAKEEEATGGNKNAANANKK